MNGLTKEQIGLERITPSMLQAYEDCPLNFYYSCWLGLKLEDDARHHMDFGNSVQDSIEVIYSMYDNNFGGAWQAAESRFDEVELFFKKSWSKDKITEAGFHKFMETRAGKESGYTKKEQLHKQFYDDGIAILKSYWAEKDNLIAQHDLDLDEFEVMIKVEMVNPTDPTDKLPIPISGRIDAKNRNKTKLIDFKTSKGAYSEEKSRKLIQCRAYPFMWWLKNGEWILNFDYIILRKGLVREERVQIINLKFDEADMLMFFAQVKSILTKIANREFPRGREDHQSFCDCYKFEKMLTL